MFDTYHLFLTGAMLDQANRAKGEAEAILSKSQATAEGIRMVSESMRAEGSAEAAKLRIAEQYITAFAALAKNVRYFKFHFPDS
uniref:STML2-like C-terminal extension domain-containing protein n=1 Tax=Aegilops tauschii subsp. strangulata TaxID=200361 RepID=A0A453RX46_AEGTS